MVFSSFSTDTIKDEVCLNEKKKKKFPYFWSLHLQQVLASPAEEVFEIKNLNGCFWFNENIGHLQYNLPFVQTDLQEHRFCPVSLQPGLRCYGTASRSFPVWHPSLGGREDVALLQTVMLQPSLAMEMS